MVGPDDLVAFSHADGGKTGQAMPLGKKILKPHAVQRENTACSTIYGANVQQKLAGLSQLQLHPTAP